MNDTTLFYGLIFLATVLFTLSIALGVVRPLSRQRKVNRRLAVIQSGARGTDSLDILKKERWLAGSDYRGNLGALKNLLVQSGVRFDPPRNMFHLALIAIGSFIALLLVLGDMPRALLGALIATVILPFFLLQRARKRRIAKFAGQLPEVIDLIVRSLRAGHPLPVALGLASREMADPAGTEFGIVADEIAFGATPSVAIANMSYRVGDPDLDYLVTCVSIQTQTGGNLGEVLSRLSKLMRERFRLVRKVKALTSEARASGMILSVFPFILFGLLVLLSPNYYEEVWHLDSFHTTLIVCAGLLFVGHLVMQRMADIKY